MKLLGAVLAGGRSSRFGSDKALALVEGRPLIAHVIAALRPQVAALVVCGRDWPGFVALTDVPDLGPDLGPGPGLGPLAGLCAALIDAERRGFDAVLCAPCDVLDLPADLAQRLSPGPAVAIGGRAVGLWPAGLASALRQRLDTADDRSIRGWLAATGAHEIDCGPLRNINRPGDLAAG